MTNLAFVDPSNGMVIGGPANIAMPFVTNPPPAGLGTLYLTEDAGAHWNLLHVPK
jgi:hypothetical protein